MTPKTNPGVIDLSSDDEDGVTSMLPSLPASVRQSFQPSAPSPLLPNNGNNFIKKQREKIPIVVPNPALSTPNFHVQSAAAVSLSEHRDGDPPHEISIERERGTGLGLSTTLPNTARETAPAVARAASAAPAAARAASAENARNNVVLQYEHGNIKRGGLLVGRVPPLASSDAHLAAAAVAAADVVASKGRSPRVLSSRSHTPQITDEVVASPMASEPLLINPVIGNWGEALPAETAGDVPLDEYDDDEFEDDGIGSASTILENNVAMDVGETSERPTKASPVPEAELAPEIPNASISDSGVCRHFWRAGDYENKRATGVGRRQGAMDHVRVHPKFLHSNATSHKWALGAVAELLDNAVDEVQNGATFVKVDMILNPRDSGPALMIQDDGGGMTPDCMRQCMSLGYSRKITNSTIGQYGNGFKTSTMRLGADVIVFSRATRDNVVTQSIGLLSYTFLRMTGHEDVVVPMVDYTVLRSTQGNGDKLEKILRTNEEDWKSNLSSIAQWSPYASESLLLRQFDDLGWHGTKVIVYNLWFNDDGVPELDFDTDAHDIQLRGGGGGKGKALQLVEQHIANRYHHSLRVYSSILYLRTPPGFQIILRGEPVEHHNISSDLKFPEQIVYKPQISNGNKETSVITVIGFTKEAPLVNVHGFNVYHKNRLIMPFWKVWQDNSSRGRGVVGVLEANFVEPAHDKQDFERTNVLLRLETRLKQMTVEYWNLHCHLIGYQSNTKAGKARKLATPPAVDYPAPIASILPSDVRFDDTAGERSQPGQSGPCTPPQLGVDGSGGLIAGRSLQKDAQQPAGIGQKRTAAESHFDSVLESAQQNKRRRTGYPSSPGTSQVPGTTTVREEKRNGDGTLTVMETESAPNNVPSMLAVSRENSRLKLQITDLEAEKKRLNLEVEEFRLKYANLLQDYNLRLASLEDEAQRSSRLQSETYQVEVQPSPRLPSEPQKQIQSQNPVSGNTADRNLGSLVKVEHEDEEIR